MMKMLLKKTTLFMLLLFFFNCDTKQQVFFKADNDAFNYIGRFDKTNPEAFRFDWPNSSIEFQFTGNQITLALEGGEKNYFNIFLDDKLHKVVHQPNDSLIKIDSLKTNKTHKIRIQKRTEGEMGISTFKGIYLPKNQKIIPSKLKSTKKIEFIGNSITCGYGTEGKSRDEKFSPSTENVNQSYALLIAKAFKAEAHIIAHSGLGVVRNYGDENQISTNRATMPIRYNQVLDTDDAVKWDFNSWQPDLVVINLGTNDYSTKPHPEKAVFQQTYNSLLDTINEVYGNLPIFLISGPLIEEPAFSVIKEIVENRQELHKNIHFIGIPKSLLNATTDLGSDSHPSAKGQLKMAQFITPNIAEVTKWEFNIDFE